MIFEALKTVFNELSGRLRAAVAVAGTSRRRQKMRFANVTTHMLNGLFVIQSHQCLV